LDLRLARAIGTASERPSGGVLIIVHYASE
jgi:hypothetical protein